MIKLKYKVGDRVRIKSLDWYNENKDEFNNFLCGEHYFTGSMKKLCSKIFEISNKTVDGYFMLEDKHKYVWTDEMIEGLVEEEVDLIPKFGEYSDNEPLNIPTMTTEFVKEYGLPCPEDCIFKDENGNVINTTKIVLEKKKKEYPKTFRKCCEMLDIDSGCLLASYDIGLWKDELLGSLQKLLICRDAYWKIAGEEMGLGKPWELSIGTPIYYIYYNRTVGTIKNDYADDIQGNVILVFPTPEMRDAFYENFEEEIENCKELL